MIEQSQFSISVTLCGVTRLDQPAVPSATAAFPDLDGPAWQLRPRLAARWCRTDDGRLEMRWASLEPPVA